MIRTNIARSGGKATVTLRGKFGEGIEKTLHDLAASLKKSHAIFDCAGVEAINSYGFRSWTKFLDELDKQATFEFVNCSPVFIEYCSLFATLSFAKRVVSLQVPYRCEDCQRSDYSIFEVDALEEGVDFEPIACAQCAGTMTPGSDEEIKAFLRARED